jgi:hypothetical protein
MKGHIRMEKDFSTRKIRRQNQNTTDYIEFCKKPYTIWIHGTNYVQNKQDYYKVHSKITHTQCKKIFLSEMAILP